MMNERPWHALDVEAHMRVDYKLHTIHSGFGRVDGPASIERKYAQIYRRVQDAGAGNAEAVKLSDADLAIACVHALALGDRFTTFAVALEAARRLEHASRRGEDIVARVANMDGRVEQGARHMVTLLDANGVVRYASPNGLARSGRRAEDVLARPALETVDDDEFRQLFAADLAIAKDGHFKQGQGWSNTPAGRLRFAYMLAPLQVEGQHIGVLALAADVTSHSGP